jgi:hypothetical protein
MAITVSIEKGGQTWNLKCEQVTHSYTRAPIQAGLPGQSGANPNVLLLDLGICIQQITIRGVVNVTSDGTGDPIKSDLDLVCQQWFESSATAADLIDISIPEGTYHGVVKSATFTKVGGVETYWNYDIMFLLA